MSQRGFGWLKDYSFPFLPYMAITWWLVSFRWGRELCELSFWVWRSGSVTLCGVVFYFGQLAVLEGHSLAPPWSYADEPGMYWY